MPRPTAAPLQPTVAPLRSYYSRPHQPGLSSLLQALLELLRRLLDQLHRLGLRLLGQLILLVELLGARIVVLISGLRIIFCTVGITS